MANGTRATREEVASRAWAWIPTPPPGMYGAGKQGAWNKDQAATSLVPPVTDFEFLDTFEHPAFPGHAKAIPFAMLTAIAFEFDQRRIKGTPYPAEFEADVLGLCNPTDPVGNYIWLNAPSLAYFILHAVEARVPYGGTDLIHAGYHAAVKKAAPYNGPVLPVVPELVERGR